MQNNILMDPDPQIVVAGLLRPDQAASRGQTAVLLTRAIDPAFRQAQWSMWGETPSIANAFRWHVRNLQPSWSFMLPGIGSAPTIAADGTIYCTTYQLETAYKTNSMLVAVRPDGTEAWSISLPMAAPTTPALGKRESNLSDCGQCPLCLHHRWPGTMEIVHQVSRWSAPAEFVSRRPRSGVDLFR